MKRYFLRKWMLRKIVRIEFLGILMVNGSRKEEELIKEIEYDGLER